MVCFSLHARRHRQAIACNCYPLGVLWKALRRKPVTNQGACLQRVVKRCCLDPGSASSAHVPADPLDWFGKALPPGVLVAGGRIRRKRGCVLLSAVQPMASSVDSLGTCPGKDLPGNPAGETSKGAAGIDASPQKCSVCRMEQIGPMTNHFSTNPSRPQPADACSFVPSACPVWSCWLFLLSQAPRELTG